MQEIKAPHHMTITQMYQAVSSSENGLSSDAAEQMLSVYGKNVLEEKKKKSFGFIFLQQLKNFMIIVLIAAAVISMAIGEASDAIIIFAVILLNSIMGAVQESKAEAALEALKKMAAPSANVIRDGQIHVVKSSDLVPGDVVILEAGDYIPADIRLVSASSLKIEEAALTGESMPAEKDASAVLPEDTPLAERVNMAFSGTNVTYGRALGVVCYTAMHTEIGKIAKALSAAKEGDTPLQKQMNKLSKVLSVAVLVIAAFIFGVGLLTGRPAMDMFLIAVSLAVAAIPEGLATVVTLQLTMGVQKMSKNGAIIRKLPAVETLGATNVICSDKTGTLTQNKMSVVKAYYNNETYDAGDVTQSRELDRMDQIFLLCNDTKVSEENGKTKLIGDPTETALYDFSAERMDTRKASGQYPRIFEIPFDSERKLMSTVNGKTEPSVLVKGAPDELLKRCTKILLGGQVADITLQHREDILSVNEQFANQALRVLGAAYKPLASKPKNLDGLEEDLIFVGLAGMMDPPRQEAREAVQICKNAGIIPVMITGDHKATAMAIARKLAILEDGAKAITGRDLDTMSDQVLSDDIDQINVYARVAPEHKVRIVRALQEKGNVVAMTGDGVNDAPALKNADIGVGMGITGTEVSKNASDMVLTDDNFATIVKAVEEGRRIYRNIKKAVLFLLSANLSEVLTLFIGTMLGAVILHPAQILWVNLVTDTFPALAIGMEQAPADIMNRRPRDSKQGFFSGRLVFDLFLLGSIIGGLVLGVYFVSLSQFGDVGIATTMAFLTLGLSQLFHAYNVRSSSRSVFSGFSKNKWMHISFVFSAFLQVIVVLVQPLGAFFRVSPLSGMQWLVVGVVSFAIIPISEIIKLIKRAIYRWGRVKT